MNIKRIITPLAFGLTLVSGFAQSNGFYTIFVAPLKPEKTLLDPWQPAMGSGLAEMLITELHKINKFVVLESTALDHLKDEIKLGQDGWVSDGEKVEKGGFRAADYMFYGTVTSFGSKATALGLEGLVPSAFGGTKIKVHKANVRIDWRIVDAMSRVAIATGKAETKETGLGFDVGVAVNGHGGRVGFDTQEFRESALGKATVKALAIIMREVQGVAVPMPANQKAIAAKQAKEEASTQAVMTALRSKPGEVTAIGERGVLVVSLGSKHGYKAGDKLALYETTNILDPKGAVAFSDEKLVGEVTLETVKENTSRASYAGNHDVKPGWVVKAK